jgi:hypothetical protein
MKAPYTIFGKTKMVEVVVYENNKKIDSDTWDEEYWIERGEDWYGLMSSHFKNKKVRIITREEWLKSK